MIPIRDRITVNFSSLKTSAPMSQPPFADTDSSFSPRPQDRIVSGRAIVIGLFALALTLTALLFVYFEFNTRPFRPLREAIGREFKKSRPNVEGGRPKGRGPLILRISMSVPFDPFEDDARAKDVLTRVLALARQHHELVTYDQIDVNLIHFVPEKDAKTKTFSWAGTDAAKLLIVQ